MGQITGKYDFLSRVNLRDLATLPTPAAGEYILVSSDNSMNEAGQGNFDCYIEGDGTKAATALELKDVDNGTYKAVFGYVRNTYEEQPFIENKYCNTNSSGIAAKTNLTTLSGTNCVYLNVNAGEKYRIYGYGPSNAINLYVLAQSGRAVVTKSGPMNARANGVVVEIPEGVGLLVVNLYNYDSSTDKVEKIVEVSADGLTERFDNLETHVETQIDGVDSKVNELEEDVNGVETTIETHCFLTANKFFNTTSHFSNGATTYNVASPADLSGCYCLKKRVLAEEEYHIHYQKGNSTAAIGLYIYTNNNGTIISSKQYSTDELVNISVDGYLYVNFYQYDALTDYVNKIERVVVGGYKDYVDQQISGMNGLAGKTIVCFGDSITEFADANMKSYPDYIAELFGAITINCGIGGTRIMQRTTPVVSPSNTDEGYAGVDIVSMVMAACDVMYDVNTSYRTIVTNAANYLKTAASDDNTAIVQRLLTVDWSNVDGVIVFAGTNDWNNGVGHWGDSGSNNIQTTMGAINEIIRLLLSTYKHLKLYWCTPIVRWLDYDNGTGTDNGWSDNNTKSGGGKSATLREFSEMMQTEVLLNHIPVLDLYNTLGINQSNFSQYFNDNDGTHPRKGFKMIAKKIGSFIVANMTM